MEDTPGTEAIADSGGVTAGESRGVYEAIFREMSDAVFLIDVARSDHDYTFTYLRNNTSHQRRTGLSEDELRGQTPRELLGDEQGTVVAENYRQCVDKRRTIEYEEELDLPGGTSHWQTKLTPIIDAGDVTQIVGVARDITEQKEQERKLKRIHRRFETVMETMSAAVFLKDADGQYLVMNQACRELFDVEGQDIVGLTDDDLFPSDTARQARTDDQWVVENGEMIEIEETIPTTAGHTVRLTRKSPVYDEDGEVVALCGVSTDITERKEREQELQMVRERFERFAGNVRDGFFLLPTDYSETEYVNPAVERIYGITPEEAYDDPTAWLRHVHPDDKDELLADMEAQRDGTIQWPVEQEFRIEHPDRGRRWVRAHLDVVPDENGDPTWITGISTDITERKEREKELQRQNSRLNEFASVVSHDLRNPLNVAQARATILQQQAADELQEHLAPLLNSLERMESIIEDTLTLARQGETVGDMSSISLVDLVGKCWAGVETAEATLEIDEEFTIHGDRDRLRHVFENLFRNAVEHGGEGLTVRVGRAGEDCLYVEDDGPGIPTDDRDAVFEPGYTSATGGTGFGLTIVKRIAEAHGWDVTITDGRDGGARFVFDAVGLNDSNA
ncbi:PAS domain-containing protein [Haloplanus natans]|uniref:PAS domain-containing protein n=1 Tax=Haloplanus natans TaxID=376171 RepID=UPI000677D17F